MTDISKSTAVPQTDTTFERHFSIGELAGMWKISRETVRQLVKDEAGVLRIRNGPQKTMTRYSIPESVARRIHTKLFNPVGERYNRRDNATESAPKAL